MAIAPHTATTPTTATSRRTAQPRRVATLNSGWRFHTGDVAAVPVADTDTAAWEPVCVPHTWNADDVHSDTPGYFRGVCWYVRQLSITEEERRGRVFVRFAGANQDARVYVNGTMVGEHLGGYTAFALDITEAVQPGSGTVLAVRLSNAHNPDVPPVAGDLCHFGGIYRSVHLVTTGPVHLAVDDHAGPGVLVDTPRLADGDATVRVRAQVVNAAAEPHTVTVDTVVSDPAGNAVARGRVEHTAAAGGRDTVTQRCPVSSAPALWSPDTPVVYRVSTSLVDTATGDVLDSVSQPLGFRWVSADAQQGLLLNGNRVFVRGVGRHQDYDHRGYAVDDAVHVQDIERIHAMGANLVRGHYPMSAATYDACDRLGVMAWAKIPIMEKIEHTDAFRANTHAMMRELVLQHYNHPSIVMWGSMCEVFGEMDWFWERPQDADAVRDNMVRTCRFTQELEDLTRELDPVRITVNDYHTDPSPHWYRDSGLTRISPLNGWNLYQGWYHDSLDNLPHMLQRCRELNEGRAYLVAEFGAGSDTRIHTDQPTIFDFSTEYEDLFHERYLRELPQRDWIAGMCLWTLFDFQIENRRDAMPHVNNKGLLRCDRTPKSTYYLYQAHWSATPMVHIASHDWISRCAVADHGDTVVWPVRVYTNAPAAELFHNGLSLGTREPRDHVAVWQVPFAEGDNRLLARAQAPSGVEDWCDIDVEFVPANLREGFAPGQRLCVNVGQSRTHFLDTLTGNRWLPDRDYRAGSFGHTDGVYYREWAWMPAWQGIREGVDANMLGTRIDPVFQTFLVGCTTYRFDVPAGRYAVRLHLAEPFTRQRRFDPAQHTGASATGGRVFDIALNDTTRLEGVNLVGQYGECRAVIEELTVDVDSGGLRVQLLPREGAPVLNGLIVERLA